MGVEPESDVMTTSGCIWISIEQAYLWKQERVINDVRTLSFTSHVIMHPLPIGYFSN